MIRNLILIFALLIPIETMALPASCFGGFPNLVTDVCLDCAFPITILGLPVMSAAAQEDYSTVTSPLCACNGPAGIPIAGMHTSFWQFARQVDITRTPYCMVLLGTSMGIGINSQMMGSMTPGNVTDSGRSEKMTFRHIHWYINPAMGLLQIALDSKCLEASPFDIPYMSEIDPSHGDDELARLLAPETYMFSNIVAQLACAADCVSSTLGFGNNLLYWCDGCNGFVFPLTGYVPATYGGVQMSSVLAHRITQKLHRALTQTSTAGDAAMCAPAGVPQINMDKRQYKYSMLYPNPQTGPGVTPMPSTPGTITGSAPPNSAYATQAQTSGAGRCCQPFGRTTVLWGSGREFPTPNGQDFGYAIFSKRDCCQSQ